MQMMILTEMHQIAVPMFSLSKCKEFETKRAIFAIFTISMDGLEMKIKAKSNFHFAL